MSVSRALKSAWIGGKNLLEFQAYGVALLGVSQDNQRPVTWRWPMRRAIAFVVMAGLLAGCARLSVNVDQEKETLLRLEREWSATSKDPARFVTYYAPDATVYPPGMPLVTGAGPILDTFTQMASSPGFALEITPVNAQVAAAGDVGWTTGTYKMSMTGVTENGKYVAVWRKQPDGNWKVVEDIFNADAAPVEPSSAHVMAPIASLQWGDGPPTLPAGTKVAVVSGDPSKTGPFIIRVQFAAGAKVMPHWHPTTENVTVLSGTMAVAMGETWDEPAMQVMPAGSFVSLPATSRHYAMAKTAATIQVHGSGPFVINYVNPADDPSKGK